MPFSKNLLDLYQQVVNTTDPCEKIELMMDLASQFVYDTDETDDNLSEDVHAMVSDFIESRAKFERRALELARAIVRSVPSYLEDNPGEAPTNKIRPN